jgi:C7-C12 aromatase (ARO/CYC)
VTESTSEEGTDNMPTTTCSTGEVVRSVEVPAPAKTAFDLIADADGWTQVYGPAVHAEYLEGSGLPDGSGHPAGTDRVRHWALTGRASIRTWTIRRELDPGAGTIDFVHEEPPAPLTGVRGRWTFSAVDETTTLVELSHTLTATDDADLVAASAKVAANAAGLLAALASIAARHEELDQLTVTFEDPMFIGGRLGDAYHFLYAADRWPARVAHVTRIDMTEDEPNVQFFDMDTLSPDGSAHTTRSVRVCFPDHKIVYKQTELAALLEAHSGRWTLTETPEGVIAVARHRATIKSSALPLLGPGTTVADARRFVRRVLGANSMNTLRFAKAYAEERAGA